MKQKLYLVFLVLLCCACNKVDEPSNCSSIACQTVKQYFKLTFTDAHLHTDLLFGPKSVLGLGDVKIYSSRLHQDVALRVDSSDSSKKYILFYTYGTDEFSIQLGDKKADRLKVETKYVAKPCCGELKITKLSLNNKPLRFSNDSTNVIQIFKE